MAEHERDAPTRTDTPQPELHDLPVAEVSDADAAAGEVTGGRGRLSGPSSDPVPVPYPN